MAKPKFNLNQLVAIMACEKQISERFEYYPERVIKRWFLGPRIVKAYLWDSGAFRNNEVKELPSRYYLEDNKVYVKPFFIAWWADKSNTNHYFETVEEMNKKIDSINKQLKLTNISKL